MLIVDNFMGQLCYRCEEEIYGQGILAIPIDLEVAASFHVTCYSDYIEELEAKVLEIEELDDPDWDSSYVQS